MIVGWKSGPSSHSVSRAINRGHSLVLTGMLAGLERERGCTLCLLAGGGWKAGLKTIDQCAYTWPLQHGGLKVVRHPKWELRVKVPRDSK